MLERRLEVVDGPGWRLLFFYFSFRQPTLNNQTFETIGPTGRGKRTLMLQHSYLVFLSFCPVRLMVEKITALMTRPWFLFLVWPGRCAVHLLEAGLYFSLSAWLAVKEK